MRTKKMPWSFDSLSRCLNRRQIVLLAYVFATCILCVHTPSFAGKEDHDPKVGTPGKRPGVGGGEHHHPGGEEEEGCSVRSSDLANFANGDAYNFRSLVGYVSNPSCQPMARVLSQQAIAEGVSWNSVPFKLDAYGKNYSKMTLDGARRLDASLATTVPALLRDNPMTSAEMLPIVGQLALLSPAAGKMGLSALIQQELMAGEAMLTKGKKSPEVARDIAKTILRLGAGEAPIASQLAEDIEERAVLAESDSLGKIFRALSAAANSDAALVPTFNLGASALNRGFQRAKTMYTPDNRKDLMTSLFSAIEGTSGAVPAMEPGAQELNEAMGALLNGGQMDEALMKKIWQRAIRVLAQSGSQEALATAVSSSITAQVIFLPKGEQELLLQAARNYPRISFAMQEKFLDGLQRSWDNLHEGRLTVERYNDLKKKFFEPMVTSLLDLEARAIDPVWLREVLKRGLVKDDDIEKRFPRFVLSLMERKDRASKIATMESGLEPTISSMAENFAVLWTLGSVHVPALNRWVEKFENQADDAEQP